MRRPRLRSGLPGLAALRALLTSAVLAASLAALSGLALAMASTGAGAWPTAPLRAIALRPRPKPCRVRLRAAVAEPHICDPAPEASGSQLLDGEGPEGQLEVPEPLGWKCVSDCGACCFLAPQDRPYLEDLLSPSEMDTFRGLVGEDGWCRHFDKSKRACLIYDDRPVFCRVKTWLGSKAEGFGVDPTDAAQLGGFCAECCREHVTEVYGKESPEMQRFNTEVLVGLDDPDQVEGVWQEVQFDENDGADPALDDEDLEDWDDDELGEPPEAELDENGQPKWNWTSSGWDDPDEVAEPQPESKSRAAASRGQNGGTPGKG